MAVTAVTRDIPFITFSAANDAATLLFELIQAKASPPNLASDENSIGFQLSLPLLSDDSDSDKAGLGSNHQGWEIGAGTPPAMLEKGLRRDNPPVLLCPPGATPASKAVRKYIKDVHASIYLHQNTGVLMLKALCDRPIIYEQGDIYDNDLELRLDEWGNSTTCVLRRERNYIRIGPYRFLLKFNTQSPETNNRFITHMNTILKSEYHGLARSRLFNFIPMGSSYTRTRWNIWLHQQLPTTEITAGVNIYTGQPVAIKKLRNKDTIIDQVQAALQIEDKQTGGILGIIDVWCDHQTSPPCLFDSQGSNLHAECQYTYYSMPLASYNFFDLPWSKVYAENRHLYLHQTLLALAELHDQQLAHGNIQPGSLLIMGDKLRLDSVTLSTQKVVLSLSMRRVEKMVSSRANICVAPEVWQNGGATTDLDGMKLDVWALASSWIYAFGTPPNRKIATKDDHEWLRNQVNRLSDMTPFLDLWQKMLAWEPQDRPTVAEVLATSEAWNLVQTMKQEMEDEKQQKRKAEIQPDGVKRVRVLSPREGDYRIFES
ncbi:kinase-like domain-containing protein [Trichoderma sp. SZMC 28014]